MQQNNINWQNKTFSQLTTDELYDLLKLRIDVFVVEQTCFYPDLDEHDRHPDTRHLFCYQNNVISAYLRILPKGLTYQDYISIGRVVTAKWARDSGLGHELIKAGLAACSELFPNNKLKISAQEHLEAFYNQHGFTRVSDMYLEDDIPHIAMVKS
jgi:ElaA protein